MTVEGCPCIQRRHEHLHRCRICNRDLAIRSDGVEGFTSPSGINSHICYCARKMRSHILIPSVKHCACILVRDACVWRCPGKNIIVVITPSQCQLHCLLPAKCPVVKLSQLHGCSLLIQFYDELTPKGFASNDY